LYPGISSKLCLSCYATVIANKRISGSVPFEKPVLHQINLTKQHPPLENIKKQYDEFAPEKSLKIKRVLAFVATTFATLTRHVGRAKEGAVVDIRDASTRQALGLPIERRQTIATQGRRARKCARHHCG
jgi:hypothetical protein